MGALVKMRGCSFHGALMTVRGCSCGLGDSKEVLLFTTPKDNTLSHLMTIQRLIFHVTLVTIRGCSWELSDNKRSPCS